MGVGGGGSHLMKFSKVEKISDNNNDDNRITMMMMMMI